MALTSANLEKAFNRVLSQYIYAAIDDIRSRWNGDDEFPADVYQNYTNIKSDYPESRTAIFTISSEVKQTLSKQFELLVQELRNVADLLENDNMEAVILKVIRDNADCVSAWMFKFAIGRRAHFGTVLSNAADKEQYFQGNIVKMLPNHRAKAVLLATIGQTFDNYLKALAFDLANLQWYDRNPISRTYYLAWLKMRDLDQIIIDILAGAIRVKAISPAKPREKKTAKSKKTDDNPVTDNPVTDNPVTDNSVTSKQDDKPPVVPADDAVTDILKDI